MKTIAFFLLLAAAGPAFSQSRFSRHEFSINAFRNPSVGLEYRYRSVSVHAGYYPTVVSRNPEGTYVTTSFVRTGLSFWFLPVGKREHPSSFYASLSWVRGLDRSYRGDHGLMADLGFRWMVWKGLNVRLGAALLTSPGHRPKLNPTPGISYSFFSR
ncbi:hypothetical protein [Larkinella soli]|uniref:hypothetical protein n=1 Tax=Larkinella soli TaxID=1770527 RepID=UPI000FFC9BFA|nr:hypothetical protein [Larkinella soli]